MPGSSALHLSLCAKGIGSVKKNGYERVDVILEPEDYYNYGADRFYLPPIHHRYAFPEDSPRQTQSAREFHELSLPKTFTTRRGALLLFSEDFALKSGEESEGQENDSSRRQVKGHAGSHGYDALNINTIGDLTRSILSYGSHPSKDEINLHFIKNKQHHIPQRVRPGFSARRYLSRLTRSFDDSFLDKLMSKGYVSEKSLFAYNNLNPSLRMRLNDDMSYMPTPYRLMKQMLVSPGMLSGCTFLKGYNEYSDISDLSTVAEEDEDVQQSTIQVLEVKDGVTRRISYSNMTHEDKEHVLADLLVKSAINHALEKQQQQQQILSDGNKTSKSLTPIQSFTAHTPTIDSVIQSSRVTEDDAKASSSRTAFNQQSTDSRNVSRVSELDMVEAVKGYIDSQLEESSPVDSSSRKTKSLQGSRVTPDTIKEEDIILKVEEAQSVHSESVGHKELHRRYSGSVTSEGAISRRSSGHSSRTSLSQYAPQPPLSPIKDLSREPTFNPHPVVPPIEHTTETLNVPNPQLTIQPPTPQNSSIAMEGTMPPVSRQPTIDTTREEVQLELEETTSRSGADDDARSWPATDVSPVPSSETLGKKSGLLVISTESLSMGSSLPAAAPPQGAFSFRGKALRGSRPVSSKSQKSQKSQRSQVSETSQQKEEDKDKGTIVFAPDGEVVRVGGAIHIPQHDAIEVTSDANLSSDIIEDEEKDPWPVSESGVSKVSGDNESATTTPREHAGSQLSGDSSHTRVLSENELVQTLTDHAHKIAALVLSRPETGVSLQEDAQETAMEIVRQSSQSVKEFEDKLRGSLTSAMSKASDNGASIPKDADISPELIDALVNETLDANDIEVAEDEESGRTTIRIKSSRTSVYSSGAKSAADSVSIKLVQDEDEDASAVKSEGQSRSRASSKAISKDRSSRLSGKTIDSNVSETKKSQLSVPSQDAEAEKEEEKTRLLLEQLVQQAEPVAVASTASSVKGPKSTKSSKSPKSSGSRSRSNSKSRSPSTPKSSSDKISKSGAASAVSKTSDKSAAKSKSDIKTEKENSKEKEEFVVGKVPDKKEMEKLYGPIEEPLQPKEKKPRVPPAKPLKSKKEGTKTPDSKKSAVSKKSAISTKSTDSKKSTKSKKGKKSTEPPKEEKAEELVEPKPTPDEVQPSPEPSVHSLEGSTKEEEEEEEMEFIIVRDEFDDDEEEDELPIPEPETDKKSVVSLKSSRSMKSTLSEEPSETIEDSDDDDPLKQISNKEARAAKRAAQAARRREEVERRRKEREDAVKRDRLEAEEKERIQREMEESMRRLEEERRNKRLTEREEEERLEREQAEKERRAALELERERRMKEEYQRKFEEMKRRKEEEDKLRRELEEQRRREAEDKRRREASMLASMAAEERAEYERRMKEEEEQRRIDEELRRKQQEEEARIAMEEAKRLAEEYALKQAEFQRRLMFNRSLATEGHGLDHTQNITKAFVWSYFELLQWLGLDVPELEKIKAIYSKRYEA